MSGQAAGPSASAAVAASYRTATGSPDRATETMPSSAIAATAHPDASRSGRRRVPSGRAVGTVGAGNNMPPRSSGPRTTSPPRHPASRTPTMTVQLVKVGVLRSLRCHRAPTATRTRRSAPARHDGLSASASTRSRDRDAPTRPRGISRGAPPCGPSASRWPQGLIPDALTRPCRARATRTRSGATSTRSGRPAPERGGQSIVTRSAVQ